MADLVLIGVLLLCVVVTGFAGYAYLRLRKLFRDARESRQKTNDEIVLLETEAEMKIATLSREIHAELDLFRRGRR